jgi:hypothetical protein
LKLTHFDLALCFQIFLLVFLLL